MPVAREERRGGGGVGRGLAHVMMAGRGSMPARISSSVAGARVLGRRWKRATSSTTARKGEHRVRGRGSAAAWRVAAKAHRRRARWEAA
jgi:hypothetical protein